MNDDLSFFVALGALLIITLLVISSLVLWRDSAKYERNFMAYCTAHGDTFAKCEQLLEAQR